MTRILRFPALYLINAIGDTSVLPPMTDLLLLETRRVASQITHHARELSWCATRETPSHRDRDTIRCPLPRSRAVTVSLFIQRGHAVTTSMHTLREQTGACWANDLILVPLRTCPSQPVLTRDSSWCGGRPKLDHVMVIVLDCDHRLLRHDNIRKDGTRHRTVNLCHSGIVFIAIPRPMKHTRGVNQYVDLRLHRMS